MAQKAWSPPPRGLPHADMQTPGWDPLPRSACGRETGHRPMKLSALMQLNHAAMTSHSCSAPPSNIYWKRKADLASGLMPTPAKDCLLKANWGFFLMWRVQPRQLLMKEEEERQAMADTVGNTPTQQALPATASWATSGNRPWRPQLSCPPASSGFGLSGSYSQAESY